MPDDETPLLESPAPQDVPAAEAEGAAPPDAAPEANASGPSPRLRDMRRSRHRPPR